MGNNKLSRGKRRQVLINLFKARVINRGKETKQLDRYLELFEVKDKMDELMKNHSQKDVSDEEFREKIKEIGLGEIDEDTYLNLAQEGYVDELEDLWQEEEKDRELK
jgi:hypothetical protein